MNPLDLEDDLSKFYGASRITVRRAIKELVKENYLEIIRGKSTFVKHETFNVSLLSIDGFTEDILAGANKLTKEIIEKSISISDDNIIKVFNRDCKFLVLKCPLY